MQNSRSSFFPLLLLFIGLVACGGRETGVPPNDGPSVTHRAEQPGDPSSINQEEERQPSLPSSTDTEGADAQDELGRGAPCSRAQRRSQSCGPGLTCSAFFTDEPGTCIPKAEAEVACEQAGGEWGTWGMMRATYCMQILDDAGQACTDGSQCEGRCLAQEDGTGQCQRLETQFGCHADLVDGQRDVTICID